MGQNIVSFSEIHRVCTEMMLRKADSKYLPISSRQLRIITFINDICNIKVTEKNGMARAVLTVPLPTPLYYIFT